MLFKERHIDMIRNGLKTATRRFWKRRCAKVGGTYPCQTKMFQLKAECPIIEANAVFEQRLGDMTEQDAHKEGGYTLEEFKVHLANITKRPWNPDDEPTVIEFEYLYG